MVLSQPEIRKAVKEGRIVFSPVLEEEQWSEASVDLRLGFSFTVLRKDLSGVRISVADGLKTLASSQPPPNRNLDFKPHSSKEISCVMAGHGSSGRVGRIEEESGLNAHRGCRL